MRTESKITVSRGIKRHLNLEHYGGKRFESVEFSAFYSKEVPANIGAEELKNESDQLYNLAEADVAQDIRNAREEIENMPFEPTKPTTPTHNFEEVPVLEGEYVEKKANVGEHNSNLYIFKKDDGEVVGVWGGTVIDNNMQSFTPGQKIQITYKGEEKGKRGKPYKDYSFAVWKE